MDRPVKIFTRNANRRAHPRLPNPGVWQFVRQLGVRIPNSCTLFWVALLMRPAAGQSWDGSKALRELERLQGIALAGMNGYKIADSAEQAARDSAIAARMRRNYCATLSWSDCDSLVSRERQKMVGFREEVRASVGRPLTRYENLPGYVDDFAPLHYSLALVTRVFRLRSEPVPSRFVLGVLPTRCLDASAHEIPLGSSDERLVVISAGLLSALKELAKVAVRTVTIDTSSEPWRVMPDTAGVVAKFQDSMVYMITHAVMSPVWGEAGAVVEQGRAQATEATDLFVGMLTFIIAHEVAHVRLGHPTSAIGLRSAGSSVVHDMRIVTHSWQMEYDADSAALEDMVPAGELISGMRQTGDLYRWGGDLYLTSLEILERAVEVLYPSSAAELKEAHPPAQQRREKIRERMRALGMLDSADLGDWFNKTLDFAWSIQEVAMQPNLADIRARTVSKTHCY